MKEMHDIMKLCFQSGVSSLPHDFPIELPLKTRQNLQLVEDYLTSSENLSVMV